MDNIEKQFVRVGDVQLHVVTAGPADGEPILMLHGFPEFWYGWHNQIPYLAEQGYRVIAPDQRGYNLSDKPEGVDAYMLDELAADVIGLVDALGYEQVNLVGHDWGAAVSWWVATKYPERLKKLVILNVPYPTVMVEAFRSGNIAQLFKSWYIGFFQIPGLPEAVLSFNDFQGLIQGMNNIGHPTSFSEEDLDQYRVAWGQPGALTGMLNWYRAMARSAAGSSGSGRKPRITVPTLMLWGEQDSALGKELAQPSIELCDEGELVFFPKATHWIQHDEADDVNRMIHDFISAPEATSVK